MCMLQESDTSDKRKSGNKSKHKYKNLIVMSY